MKIQALIGVVVASATLAIFPARAAVLTESFDFTGSVYSVAGKFAYDQSTGALQWITGKIVTTTGTDDITGLVPGSSPFFPIIGNVRGFHFSNIFDAATQTFPVDGILFSFGSANFGNLYFDLSSSIPTPVLSTWLPDGPTSPLDCSATDLYCPGDSGTINFAAVSPVPELSTWVMMLLGFIGIGLLGRPIARLKLTRGSQSVPLHSVHSLRARHV